MIQTQILLLVLLAELGAGHRSAKQGCHGRVIQRLFFDVVEPLRFFIRAQKLHGANAVASDGGEQVEGVLGAGGIPLRETFSDGTSFRQLVLEEVLDGVATQGLVNTAISVKRLLPE